MFSSNLHVCDDIMIFTDTVLLQEDKIATHSSWGKIIRRANLNENNSLKKFRLFNQPAFKRRLEQEGEVFGAIVTYRFLKQIMLATLRDGYALDPRGKGAQKRCLNEVHVSYLNLTE
jgi:hypothetical protein